jgi:hypothetical protein
MRSFKAGIVLGVFQVLSASATGGIPISPYLIGENAFNADVAGKDADRVWGRMKDARFRIIRIGGISNNDKTPSAADHARWIDSIRSIGAEPLVQVSSIDPAKTAADLVRALNIDRKYAIRFWSIGNEPTCVEKTTPAKLAAIQSNTKERALAMRAVDPSIQILFGDECYWKPDYYDPLIGGANDVTGDTLIGSGADARRVRFIDGITFHTYPLPGATRETPYTRNDVVHGAIPNVREQFRRCVKRAAFADSLHHREGAGALSISLTEFNVTYWNSSDNSPAGVGVRSFVAGQFVAEVFGMGMESGALTVAPWSMLESGGDGRDGDLGLFDGAGAIVPRPAYHHIKMIADNMSGSFIASAVDGMDLVHSYSTQDKDQAAVLILNENETKGFRIAVRFSLDGPVPPGSSGVRIDAGWNGEVSDTVAPQSTLLLKARKPGAVLVRTSYSLAMAQKYAPPKVEEMPVALAPGARESAIARDGVRGLSVGSTDGVLRGGLGAPSGFEVSLHGWDGRRLARTSGMGETWELDARRLSPGAYVLRVRAAGETRSRRIALP